MHVLAILGVLAALALAFGVIGMMLIGHRQQIINALLPAANDREASVALKRFQPNTVRSKRAQPTLVAPIRARQSQAFAA